MSLSSGDWIQGCVVASTEAVRRGGAIFGAWGTAAIPM